MNSVLIAIILVPVIEIYLFIKIGSQIGAFNTISLIFLTAIIGIFYARYEGLNTLKSGFTQLVKKELPAYETIITDFSDQDNKITNSKPLLSEKIYSQFKTALVDRSKRGHFAEITFIGINSAKIKEHNKIGSILRVTVDFVAEVITCIKDKEKKIVSGDPETIKKIYDTWVFSRDTKSNNPKWQLVDTLT